MLSREERIAKISTAKKARRGRRKSMLLHPTGGRPVFLRRKLSFRIEIGNVVLLHFDVDASPRTKVNIQNQREARTEAVSHVPNQNIVLSLMRKLRDVQLEILCAHSPSVEIELTL